VNLKRILILAAAGVLAGGLSRADIPVGGTFNINLNDIANTDAGGWLSDSQFTAVINPIGIDSGTFTPNTICTSRDDDDRRIPGCDRDPTISINPGGDPTAVELSTFSFESDGNGGGTLAFINDTGVDITSLLITSMDYPNSFFSNQTFFCDTVPNPSFDFCGFKIVGDPRVEILFADNPEPNFSFALLAGAGLLALHNSGKNRKSRS
jgi:hypothetical protein